MHDRYLCVEFVTPDTFLEVHRVLSITSYTVDGEFVVLPGHEKFIIELRSGIIKLKLDVGTDIFYVLNPVLKVTSDNCKVIANQLVNANSIDTVMLKQYKEDIEKILHLVNDKILVEVAKKQLAFVNNII
ncbi:MAG: F0F1 ATP synthase subunit epsilon [Ehrlichia sp.]